MQNHSEKIDIKEEGIFRKNKNKILNYNVAIF